MQTVTRRYGSGVRPRERSSHELGIHIVEFGQRSLRPVIEETTSGIHVRRCSNDPEAIILRAIGELPVAQVLAVQEVEIGLDRPVERDDFKTLKTGAVSARLIGLGIG